MTFKTILACLIMASSVGCAKVRIVGREIDPVVTERTIHRCGWNLNDEDETTEISVSRLGTIGSVKVSMNYFQAIGTVLSFGLWMPFNLTVEVNR